MVRPASDVVRLVTTGNSAPKNAIVLKIRIVILLLAIVSKNVVRDTPVISAKPVSL